MLQNISHRESPSGEQTLQRIIQHCYTGDLNITPSKTTHNSRGQHTSSKVSSKQSESQGQTQRKFYVEHIYQPHSEEALCVAVKGMSVQIRHTSVHRGEILVLLPSCHLFVSLSSCQHILWDKDEFSTYCLDGQYHLQTVLEASWEEKEKIASYWGFEV